MIRLAQAGLFLAPLALYLVWRASARRGMAGPGPMQFAAVLAALLGLGVVLAFVALRDPLPTDGVYVPPEVRDGRIVPGHVR